MEGFCLVATSLSSINLSAPSSVVVSTARQNAPLASTIPENDVPADHATCSSVLTTSTTGTILLRVIHGGLVVELIALSASVPPLRVIFPALVLSKPALFLWKETELHLLVMTDIGSLFRLVIPVDGFKLWNNQTGNVWPREFFIRSMPQEHMQECAFYAQGTHSVAVSLPNGDLLRIESESSGYDGHEGWVETVFHHSSFLSSLTSYLPIQTGIPGASDIISLISHPWPTDIGHIWTLSRDRTLRIWNAKLGCVASKTLQALPNARELPSGSPGNNKYSLLDAEQQNLLRVFSHSSNERVDIYVIAFVPTSSSTTGGFFVVLDSSSDQLVEVGIIECPKHTAHCHLQDFMIHDKTLYTLWDRQGQSMIEQTEINVAGLKTPLIPPVWKASHYAHEPELTPAYMEEQLLNSGTLNETFLNAIMKPGVFSSLTLRIALDRYIDACLTLPGSPPSQLLNTYTTLSENIVGVVGCTVTLNRDPQTGGFQHANYWTALKRDWEGFVARCRDVERSARWPLVIGTYGPDGIIVVERERIASLVDEDAAISLRRMLELDLPPHPQHELLATLWGLRLKLGPRALSQLENRVMDLLHQEIAFSFAEILQDSARRLKFHELLDEGEQEWFTGRLSSIQDLDTATRVALDCIGGFDLAVKKEEMEVELLTMPPPSEWMRSQAAAYSMVTIEARYGLCLCVIILLFFYADELDTWDASLLAEILAVFRGVAMLRLVGSQPADGGRSVAQGEVSSPADDVIAHMRNLNVSGYKSQPASKLSLMQLLISQTSVADDIATTAHNFLDGTGMLRSLSPAHTTQHEIVFTNRIRLLDFVNISWELLSLLPRTPGALFLQSQVLRQLGRIDDAADLLETLAGCIGIANMTLEDSSALTAVLPNGQIMDSEYSYYLFAAELFRHEYVCHEVNFSKLALQVSPAGIDTAPLWKTIVKGLADLGLYEEAYANLMQVPSERLKRDLACQLAIQMCEENAVEKLVQFEFATITNEIEAALAFKARNADPRSRPSYSKILYAWYIRKGDYRNAALTMYQRSRKLRDIIVDAKSFVLFAEDQLEALSIAINALYLVDEKFSWILVPVMPDSNRQLQKLSKHIPESKYVSSKYDAEIIHLNDLEYKCALLRAQIDNIKRDPSLLSSPEYLLPPAIIVMRLAQESQYTKAFHLAHSLKVEMTDIFIHLTNQCIRLTGKPGSTLQEDMSGWLLTDNVASWHGSPSDRGWRYLQQSLGRYDGPINDCRYAKSVFESILSSSRLLSPPLWLIDILEKHNPEYLIRVNLRYENIVDAINYTYALVLKSDKQQLAQESSKTASTTWLPYSLIDQVLSAAEDLLTIPPNLSELRTLINNRVKRMQKISRNIIDM